MTGVGRNTNREFTGCDILSPLKELCPQSLGRSLRCGYRVSEQMRIGHLKPFGCQVTILNTSDHLGKFEGKADEGYLVGFAPNSKAYRVYNLTNKRVEETMNLRFLEDKPNVQGIDGKLLFFDVGTSFDSAVHRVHAVSFDAAVLDVASTVSAACIIAATTVLFCLVFVMLLVRLFLLSSSIFAAYFVSAATQSSCFE
ncbi:hypothetical protein Tco_0653582 [Tanacetum coccineum]|uniref:Retroviral polymerase SH3-like domain-containing protein n=1 Tax=Tanacetum coccineum TaxID=301880 RepID=A0ABQ4X0T2_9ASTR